MIHARLLTFSSLEKVKVEMVFTQSLLCHLFLIPLLRWLELQMLELLALFKVFLMRVLGRHRHEYQSVIGQLLELNKKASLGVTALAETIPNIRNEFLKEAVSIVAAGILTEAEMGEELFSG